MKTTLLIVVLLVCSPPLLAGPLTPSSHQDNFPTLEATGWNIEVSEVIEVGGCSSVLVSGELAYAAFDGVLSVLDLSNELAITRIGAMLFQGRCFDMALRGSHLYCSRSNSILIVDVSDPFAPVAGPSIAANGQMIEIEGSYLLARHGSSSVRVYDIATPTSPILVGEFATFLATDVAGSNGFLYVTRFTGEFQVLDFANPSNPVQKALLPIGGTPSGVEIFGEHAYVAHLSAPGGGLRTIEVTDPDAPIAVDFDSSTTGYVDIDTVEPYLYALATDGTIDVFDLGNPANPVKVAAPRACNLYSVTNLDAAGDLLVVSASTIHEWIGNPGDYGVCVMSVDDPINPAPVGFYESLPVVHSADVAGDHLVFSMHHASLLTMNRYDPSQRHFVRGNSGIDVSRVAAGSGYAYVTGADNFDVGVNHGLTVYDIAQPEAPQRMGFLPSDDFPYYLTVGASHVYFRALSGLHIADVGDPSHPTLVNQSTISGNPCAAEPYLLLASGDADLRVADVSDPSSPFITGTGLPLGGTAREVRVVGPHAYVASGGAGGGLWIVDVSDPLSPSLSGGFPGDFFTLQVRDKYVYVADASNLRILDVSNPASPVEVGNLAVAVKDFVVAPPFLYVVSAAGPVLVLDTDLITAVPQPYGARPTLQQNYPNPFNPSTTIVFELHSPARARIEFFDVRGRSVRVLVDETRPAGTHTVAWDGRASNDQALPSGVYFYRLTVGSNVQTKKMMILK